eukprot:5213180-Prymnesium_polylepis.1
MARASCCVCELLCVRAAVCASCCACAPNSRLVCVACGRGAVAAACSCCCCACSCCRGPAMSAVSAW